MQTQKSHKSQEALRHAIYAMLGSPLESLDCRKTVYDGWRKSLMSRNDVTDLGGVVSFLNKNSCWSWWVLFSILTVWQVYHLLLKASPRLFRCSFLREFELCKELCRAIFNGALAFGFLLHGCLEMASEFLMLSAGWLVGGLQQMEKSRFFVFLRCSLRMCLGGLQTSCSSPIKGPILPPANRGTRNLRNFMPPGIRSASQLRSFLRTLLNPQKMNLKCCKTSPLIKSKKRFLRGKNWRVRSETWWDMTSLSSPISGSSDSAFEHEASDAVFALLAQVRQKPLTESRLEFSEKSKQIALGIVFWLTSTCAHWSYQYGTPLHANVYCKGIQQLHPTQSGYTLQGSKVEWDLRCVCQTIHGFAMPLSMNPCQLHLGFVVWHVSLLHRRSSLGSFSWSSVGFGSLVEATTRLGPEKQLHRCNVFSKKNCTIDWLYSHETALTYQGGKKSKDFRCVLESLC